MYRKLTEAVASTKVDNPTLPKPSTYRVVVRTNASKDLSDHGYVKVTAKPVVNDSKW